MSPAIRGLEETPGVRLLSRATRSVAPTEAGEQLLARLRPARFLRPDRPGRWNNIVITMRAMHVSLRQIGSSHGVVIPKPVLAQLGLDAKAGVEMTIEDGALVLRRPASPARTSWAEAARSIAQADDDELVMGEFGNAGDSELVWGRGERFDW
jgi:antitoxin MazE